MAAVISDIDHDDLLQVIMEARLTDAAVLSDFLRHIAGDAALSLRRIHTIHSQMLYTLRIFS